MPDAVERKAKRIKRTRSLIMDAAVRVIAEKGFKNTTTREIADEAEMAEGTLYNYFKNKDDILMSIAERYVSKKRNLDVSTDVGSVQEFIENLNSLNVQADAEGHLKEREVLKALLPEFLTDKTLGRMYHDRIVAPYLETLEEKLEILKQKKIVGDFDVRILSRLFYTSLIGFAVLEINRDPLVTDASPEFRAETGKAYIEVLGKGMSR